MTYIQLKSDLPYTEAQYAWARRRPAPDRTPIPRPGDAVRYRHDELGPVCPAEVMAVQSLEDFDDPNLWYFQTDVFGQPVLIEGRRVLARAHDPWPLVTMTVAGVMRQAREARLPGAAGWLPLGGDPWRPFRSIEPGPVAR